MDARYGACGKVVFYSARTIVYDYIFATPEPNKKRYNKNR
jgi:hypothetical protein